jgi:hypothetical protein
MPWLYADLSQRLNSLTVSDKRYLLATVVLIGIAATAFKRTLQLTYGFCEVSFALVSGWYALDSSQSADPIRNIIVLLGVMYIVRRDMSNVVEGWQNIVAKTNVAVATQLKYS